VTPLIVPPAPLSAAIEPLIEPATTIPNLKTQAWRHLVLAYDFFRERGDALLAMGMGTGKSLVAIGAVCNLDVDLSRPMRDLIEQAEQQAEAKGGFLDDYSAPLPLELAAVMKVAPMHKVTSRKAPQKR
jgi:hypothetical protein